MATIDDKMDLTVDAILADPSFDIEQFIHNVTLHLEKPKVLGTLVSDPAIRLAIAESDNYAILTHLPGEAEDFFKMSTLGLETWCKKTGDVKWGNVWYGIVVNDDLAIGYRRVNHDPEVTVWKSKDAAKSARSRWRQLKLQELGKEKDVTSITPGHRYIDKIRKAIYELMMKKNFSSSSYRSRRSKLEEGIVADISLDSPYRKGRNNNNYHYGSDRNVVFRVETSGAKNIKVHVRDMDNTKQSSYDHRGKYDDAWENIRMSILDPNTKTNMPPADVAETIFKWLKATNKDYRKASSADKVSV